MDKNNINLDVINKFLNKEVFQVNGEFQKYQHFEMDILDVKVKVTGVKDYISIGKRTPHIQYTLYVLESTKELNNLYPFYNQMIKKEEDIYTDSSKLHTIIHNTNYELKNFLLIFDLKLPVICTKIVNLM